MLFVVAAEAPVLGAVAACAREGGRAADGCLLGLVSVGSEGNEAVEGAPGSWALACGSRLWRSQMACMCDVGLGGRCTIITGLKSSRMHRSYVQVHQHTGAALATNQALHLPRRPPAGLAPWQ